MKNKSYIVTITTGSSWDRDTYNKFVTLDKEYADTWVEKFNRIIENNKERIDKFAETPEFYNDETQLFWAEYIHYQSPSARVEEIELR